MLVGVGQIGQVLKSSNDLRKYEIDQWVESDKSRAEIAQQFVSTCLDSIQSFNVGKTISDEPLSVYKCGESIGAHDLVNHIRNSDMVLKSLAWPLSAFQWQ